MYNLVFSNEKAQAIATKAKKKISDVLSSAVPAVQKFIFTAGIYLVYARNSISAFAVTIKHDYSVKDLSNVNPEGLILGLAFWICRIIGVAMLVWGIYGYVTARKDGEAESMNGAIGKLISGVVLIAMPNVLSGLDII